MTRYEELKRRAAELLKTDAECMKAFNAGDASGLAVAIYSRYGHGSVDASYIVDIVKGIVK